MKFIKLFKKGFNRINRIAVGKKGIYGKIGKGNKFTTGVFISEGAVIGNNNYFGPYSMINNAVVGNYCSIGPGVKIGQAEHSKSYLTTFQKISKQLIGHSLNSTPSIIGSDVWCGANVVILQGVKIGDGAIIGANAVVTKNIPEYGIAVGVPARVINYRFDDDVISVIKESRWFEHNLKEAKQILKLLENQLNLKRDK